MLLLLHLLLLQLLLLHLLQLLLLLLLLIVALDLVLSRLESVVLHHLAIVQVLLLVHHLLLLQLLLLEKLLLIDLHLLLLELVAEGGGVRAVVLNKAGIVVADVDHLVVGLWRAISADHGALLLVRDVIGVVELRAVNALAVEEAD